MPVALVLRHLEIAHLGNLDAVLRGNDYDIRYLDVTTGSLEDHPEPDLVVVLGGDMGVYEKEAHPFLVGELAYLRDRLAAERPTLGICLGAQLIAEALGETVRRGKTVEIGFREVTPTEAGLDSPLRHVVGVPMMQWHGDTFGLPSGAIRLASSSAYSNEAFALGDYALAVQFHPELSAEMYDSWIAEGLDELAVLGIEPDDLRREALAHGPAMQAASVAMFSEWLRAL
jgi:GMP synthase (glutamine-hydrolysing)